jgi:hypothetical protein
VPGLVAEEHHDRPAVFDLSGLLLLEADQAGVGKIERDADDGRPVRTAPFVRQVDIGLEAEPPRLHLPAQPADVFLHGRALDGQVEPRNGGFQELEPDGLPTLDECSDRFAAHLGPEKMGKYGMKGGLSRRNSPRLSREALYGKITN